MSIRIDKSILYPTIKRPSCRVMLIGGPPGSGKSYYVRTRRSPNDIVIDLDEIMAELSGQSIYQADKDKWIMPSLKERNRRLSLLCNEKKDRVAWFIVCASGSQWMWWRRTLRPDVAHSCWVSQDVCMSRIKSDQRRAHDMARHIKACADWFKAEQASIKNAVGCGIETDWAGA
jgi:adenylate kinase family enzyme